MSILLIDIQGQELQPQEVEMLSHPLVAGIILFSRNFYDREQVQALIKSIRQRVKKPLLITVDQEGGRVQRFRDGFTALPAMQAFSALVQDEQQQEKLAYEAGWLMAAEMVALDIDLSFAPVLDLGHQCRAIGDRSFHQDANCVLRLARQFVMGMRQAGMATTGKHFPGHGHVLADSHLETPFDDRPQAQIFSQDIQPFQQLIQQDLLDAVMPAHVVYRQCDDQPASGSAYWLQTVLRQQLGFNGAIFSDDLGMKGAGVMGDFVTRCEKSWTAGCDLLLLCNEPEGIVDVLDHFIPPHNPQRADLQQARLARLFKKSQFSWNELSKNPRYLQASKQLSALQQDWLATKA